MRKLHEIEFWEYPALVLFMVFLGVIYARRKRIMQARHPEYKHYITGLYARILGGLVFTLVYVYYYGGAGDGIAYFQSSVPLAELCKQDPVRYVQALFAENTWENYRYYFDRSTGYPIGFVYIDPRTYILVRVISPLTLISMNSIVLTTAFVSTLCYGGVWRLYRMLVGYYPDLQGRLAFAVLFFPSSVFWGSGILKDTFTFTAVCWYLVGLNDLFLRRKGGVLSWVQVIFSTAVMLAMKPYVFMTIFPASLLWVLYHRVQRLRNGLLRVMLLPAAMVVLAWGSLFMMEKLGDRLGKFSLDNALKTILVTQQDMMRAEQYGTNYFDLGKVEATWSSVFSKFPQATFAGLFRPTLLDVRNVVILIAALENTFLLLMALYILWRTRVVYFITLLLRNPLLQMCFLFSVGYAFMIAVSTPNFGALVRFKIPLLPLFVSALFITNHILDRRAKALGRGGTFRFEDYSDGDPLARVPKEDPKAAAKKRKVR